MDPFAFPPIATLLNAAYSLVTGLVALIDPIAGSASAAVAIIVLTLVVRTVLIPVGASQVKAEWTRRRLAPKLQALQKRYKKNPQLLQQKTMELYRQEKASPFAGMLPTLLQLPVISIVYALFIHTSVDGQANALLGERLAGVPLGHSFTQLVASGAAWPGFALYACLFVIMAAVAWMSRRTALRLMVAAPDAPPAQATLNRVLSWLPFATLPFAAFVPLAAALYLTTTTAWTLVERALLRRRFWQSDEAKA